MSSLSHITQSPPKLPIHQNIRDKLHSFYVSNRIPHIIFYGSSGTGKQSLVYDFLREIYHGSEQKIKSNVMFVNCAHGKGIKFIREELKFFAKTNVQFNSGIWFKTIVLLNADHLTMDAQSALRRCIELFSHNTRFFIIVENKHKLLNPILSRFCEIHVPEYMNDKGETINLHQWQIQQTYCFQESIKEKQNILDSCIIDYSGVNGKTKMLHLAEELYEKGISSLDIIQWLKTGKNNLTELEKANICMCFSKIKSEFRCEKMLMLYLLDFLSSCSDCDLKTISFM